MRINAFFIQLLTFLLLVTNTVPSIADTGTEAIDSPQSELSCITYDDIIEGDGEIPTITAAPEAPEELLSRQAIEKIVTECQCQLDELLGIITALATMINDHQVPTLKNRQEALEAIQSISYTLQVIRQNQLGNIDSQNAYFLVQLTQTITQHLSKAIESGCTRIAPFDPKSLMTKRAPQKLHEATIIKILAVNKTRLQKLAKGVNVVGLTRINKIYRFIDQYFLSPGREYSVMRRAALLLSTYVTAGYWWWMLHWSSFKTWFPGGKFCYDNILKGIHKTHNESIQDRAEVEKSLIAQREAAQLINKTPVVAPHVMKVDSLGYAYTTGQLTIGYLLFQSWWWLLKSEWEATKVEREKFLDYITGKLKGGEYLKKARKYEYDAVDVRFKDIIGYDYIKSRLSDIVRYLENPEAIDRISAAPPKGILLIGKTRTGKSYMVKALEGEIKDMLDRTGRGHEIRFFSIPASVIYQEGIDRIFSLAKQCAPCVVFIDELDILQLQRPGSKELHPFLLHLSGAAESHDPKNQVIFIAASNKPETIDFALRSKGRYGLTLHFDYPTFDQRKEYIVKELVKRSLHPQFFDVDSLAKQTEGKSFEDLKEMIKSAVRNARSLDQPLSQNILQAALDEEVLNIIPLDVRRIAPKQKQLLACHFAGPALFLSKCSEYHNLARVTIREIKSEIKEEIVGSHLINQKNQKHTEYGQIFTHQEFDPIDIMTHAQKVALGKYYLAGFAAEQVLLGAISYGCHERNAQEALEIAQSITSQGVDLTKLPAPLQEKYLSQALALRDQWQNELIAEFTIHKKQLTGIANVLMMRETISDKEVEYIINVVEHPEIVKEYLEKNGITIPEDSLLKTDQLIIPSPLSTPTPHANNRR